MKTFNLFFVLSIFIFASCETADMAENQNSADLKFASDANIVLVDEDPIGSPFRFSAVVNGSYFRAINYVPTPGEEYLTLEAVDGQVPERSISLILKLPAEIAIGDYGIGNSIGGSDFQAAVTINGRTQQVNIGRLHVTNHEVDNGEISGRFSLQTAEFNVSHGVFRLSY